MELLTDRLLLRPPVAEDAADALAMLQDPETVQWHAARRVVDLASAVDWCERGADWSSGSHATWHAVDRNTGRLAGNCSVFSIDLDFLTAKISYRVAPWTRRQRVGGDMVDAVTLWSFAELGLKRMQLEHAVPNIASCRLANARGFVLEGTLQSASVDGFGVRHDDHVHGRLAPG